MAKATIKINNIIKNIFFFVKKVFKKISPIIFLKKLYINKEKKSRLEQITFDLGK